MYEETIVYIMGEIGGTIEGYVLAALGNEGCRYKMGDEFWVLRDDEAWNNVLQTINPRFEQELLDSDEFEEATYRCVVQTLQKCLAGWNINATSKTVFYNIGQGLMVGVFLLESLDLGDIPPGLNIDLRTGEIILEVSPKTTVLLYDCGSGIRFEDEAELIIEDFVEDCRLYCGLRYDAPPEIDYLFISHFDSDHVNGIPYLFGKVGIKNIVMAYQKPIDGVIQLSASYEDDNNAENFESVVRDGDYLDAYNIYMQLDSANAIYRFMMDNDLGNVNIIRLHNTPELRLVVGDVEEISEDEKDALGILPKDLRVIANDEYEENNIRVYEVYQNALLEGSEDEYHNVTSIDLDFWKLVIIYYLPDGEDYEGVRRKFIEKLFEKFPEYRLDEDIDSRAWCDRIFEILSDGKNRSKIREIYKSLGISDDINKLSLCMAFSHIDSLAAEDGTHIDENGDGEEGNGEEDNGEEDNGGEDNGGEDNGGEDNGEEDNGEEDNGEEDNGEEDNGEEDNDEEDNGEEDNDGEYVFPFMFDISELTQGVAKCELTVAENTVILTGDSDLRISFPDGKMFCQKVLETLRRFGFSNIAVSLLPHHGSMNNSNSAVVDLLTNEKYSSTCMVVSYGSDNRYGHPHSVPCVAFGNHICLRERSSFHKDAFSPKLGGETVILTPVMDEDDGERLKNNKCLFHCHEECRVVFTMEHIAVLRLYDSV